MKKEFVIGCFLVLMLTGALINNHFLVKLTEHVTEKITITETYARQEDWVRAERSAEEATALWTGSDTYTHLVLRHTEIDAATDLLYALLEQVYVREAGAVKAAAQAASARMTSISSIEQIRLGSIF